MKTVVADPRYLVYCVRIETVFGGVVRLTDYPRELVMGNGSAYQSDSGYQFTGIQSGSSMSPGAMDIEGIADAAGISRDAIGSGVFDNARLYVFATSWKTPVEDEEPIGAAILGKATLMDKRYRIEMMSLIDALNQSAGSTYSPACPKTFGGQEYAGCKIDLAAITVSGSITSISSRTVMRDSVRTEPEDYFGAGYLTWTSGPNAGLKPQEVKSYAADGTIETYEPAYYSVSVGDTYTLVPGCRKRLQDCRDKWANVVNFGGFSYVPTGSTYGQVGSR